MWPLQRKCRSWGQVSSKSVEIIKKVEETRGEGKKGNLRLVRGRSLKLPESAGTPQSVWEISWLLSLGGEGRAWPGPQPHSRMASHSWKKRPSLITALSAP